MGLFAGTDIGYELERPATRIEILVMLIKLLGENDKALSYSGKHPFSDVPAWADTYVAFAYNKGYTAGTSVTTFSPNNLATGDQYATFVLKALGYDSDSDFSWDKALAFSESLKVISAAEFSLLNGTFLRDKMVYLSFCALSARYKNGSSTLIQGLIGAGIISQKIVDEAFW